MNLITRPFDYSTLEGADRAAVKLYNKPLRWFTTVGLQGILGLWFLVAPAHTLAVIWVPYSPPMAALFQLYGAMMISRTVMEQYVRSRLNVEWIHVYIIASLPFELISTGVLLYVCLAKLMNPWIGWFWLVMFLSSAAQHAYIAIRALREKKSPASRT
jgi:hypothetical protein